MGHLVYQLLHPRLRTVLPTIHQITPIVAAKWMNKDPVRLETVRKDPIPALADLVAAIPAGPLRERMLLSRAILPPRLRPIQCRTKMSSFLSTENQAIIPLLEVTTR